MAIQARCACQGEVRSAMKCICFKFKCACGGDPRPADPLGLTIAQRNFVYLHRDYFVESWHSLFQGGMIRARTDKGRTATIMMQEVIELCSRGYMVTSHGNALLVTELGKQI